MSKIKKANDLEWFYLRWDLLIMVLTFNISSFAFIVLITSGGYAIDIIGFELPSYMSIPFLLGISVMQTAQMISFSLLIKRSDCFYKDKIKDPNVDYYALHGSTGDVFVSGLKMMPLFFIYLFLEPVDKMKSSYAHKEIFEFLVYSHIVTMVVLFLFFYALMKMRVSYKDIIHKRNGILL